MKNISVCTIIAKNYLALAKTLANSLQNLHPLVDFHVLVIDPFDFLAKPLELGKMTLDSPTDFTEAAKFKMLAFKYDITELSTAVKPFYLEYLLLQGYEKVIYFDPDILILQPLDQIFQALDTSNIVLIPHILDPIVLDGCLPSEITLLQSGTYNLGFIGIAQSQETRRFLAWWGERLEKYCRVTPTEGLSVDQKWIDLVPGMFENVQILTACSYGVAYWNLNARHLSKRDGVYWVDDEPVVFFHFSGFNPDYPTELSKHQNRLRVEALPSLAGLLQHYASLLKANGHDEYKHLPYGYSSFSNGVPIDDLARSLLNGDRSTLPSRVTPSGVNVAGYLTAELGVGEAARSYITALKSLGVQTALTDFAAGTPSRKADNTLSGFGSTNPYPINLICVNADQLPKFIIHASSHYFEQKHNIGVWWWELPEFPKKWWKHFAYFNEIWVGSIFTYQAISKHSPIPVVKIPPVVDLHLRRVYSKQYFGLADNEFTFLFVFDFFSYFERKNPLAVVAAFKNAFSPDEPVQLVLKCINGEYDPVNFNRLKDAIGDSRICIIDSYLSKDEKNGLIDACDCYVSLHRSEGFGLTLAEAMFLEKPAIATAWSGNMDFMTVNNSYPVEYELTSIKADYGPYKQGQIWAEPSIEHAAQLMRQVYEQPEEANKKAKRAAADIRSMHSPAAVAELVKARLDVLKFGPVNIPPSLLFKIITRLELAIASRFGKLRRLAKVIMKLRLIL